MAFKTFVDGNVLDAADLNDYLMKQSVIVCTSATRPSSPNEGMCIYETDTDKVMVYDGSSWMPVAPVGAWTSYTPTWGGAVTLGSGTSTGAYQQQGKTVRFRAQFVFGAGSSISTAAATCTLPVTGSSGVPMGGVWAEHFDTSASQSYMGAAKYTSTSVASIYIMRTATFDARMDSLQSTLPMTWATGDEIRVYGEYEAA